MLKVGMRESQAIEIMGKREEIAEYELKYKGKLYETLNYAPDIGIGLADGDLMKTFTAYVEWDPDTKLYVGIIPGIPGAHTQGTTWDELQPT